MRTEQKLNMTMLCDFYELTMGNGYFQTGMRDRVCYFDVFFRSVPDGGGFAIAAGLEQVIRYIQDLHFDEEDIQYLRGKGCFSTEFLDYLRNFRFTGDIWAVPEGTPIFPREPILTVRAPAIQAQFVETYLLLALNHQSLIATKSNRIVRAAEGRPVSEFGSRRAQGSDGAVLGARASYIAGCSGTACAMADELYGTPATGTMAHSWVQMFPDEYTAFKTYCQVYPRAATLLVDTYNVLHSGVPNDYPEYNGVAYEYNPEKAKQLLADAGYPDGFEFTYTTYQTSLNQNFAEVLQNMWAQIGVKANIDIVDLATFTDMNNSGKLTAALMTPSVAISDPSAALILWPITRTISLRHNDQHIQDLLDAGASTYDENERVKIYQELQDYLQSMTYTVPIAYPTFSYGISSNVDGFVFQPSQIIDLTTISFK